MTKTQIESAANKDLAALKENAPPTLTSDIVNQCLDIATKVIIGRICLELAREGYEFKKNINWKPL